jgi:hypothetical protein
VSVDVLLLGIQLLSYPAIAAKHAKAVISFPPITRAQVLANAKTWVDAQVPYDSGLHQGYNTDCVGFVSMAWGVAAPGMGNTTLALQYVTQLNSVDDLQPGDALLNSIGGSDPYDWRHIILFVSWVDQNNHSAGYIGEELTPAGAHEDAQVPLRYYDGYDPGEYQPVRYKGILDPSQDPNQPSYYANKIVQWNGDTKQQKTSWYVSSDLKRYWIPDSSTFYCLEGKGVAFAGPISSTLLDQLPDQTGQRATCNGTLTPPPGSPSTPTPPPPSSASVSGPVAISFEGDLNVFGIGSDGQVYQDYWSGSRWSGWSSIQGKTAQSLAVVINGPALNIFQLNANGQIYTEYNNGSGWSGWASLGGHAMAGAPAVITYGSSQVDVFDVDTNKVPYVDVWTASGGWSGWTSMGNYMGSGASPSVITYQSGEMDLFYRGGDNQIYQNKTFDGKSWSGFFSLGAPTGATVASDPFVFNYPPEGEFDVYVNTTSGHIYKRMFNGSWSTWTDQGGAFVGKPFAVQYGSDMNLFARGTDGHIYQRYWSYSGQFWSVWGSLGGNLAGDPFVLAYSSSELDVFATDPNGLTEHDTQTGNGWAGFSPL